MRKINFDEYIREKKEKYFAARARLGGRRGARRKPRNPEERKALMKMDYLRWRKWLEDGTLVIVSPRKYVFKLM